MRKKISILALLLSCASFSEDFDKNTPTYNNWKYIYFNDKKDTEGYGCSLTGTTSNCNFKDNVVFGAIGNITLPSGNKGIIIMQYPGVQPIPAAETYNVSTEGNPGTFNIINLPTGNSNYATTDVFINNQAGLNPTKPSILTANFNTKVNAFVNTDKTYSSNTVDAVNIFKLEAWNTNNNANNNSNNQQLGNVVNFNEDFNSEIISNYVNRNDTTPYYATAIYSYALTLGFNKVNFNKDVTINVENNSDASVANANPMVTTFFRFLNSGNEGNINANIDNAETAYTFNGNLNANMTLNSTNRGVGFLILNQNKGITTVNTQKGTESNISLTTNDLQKSDYSTVNFWKYYPSVFYSQTFNVEAENNLNLNSNLNITSGIINNYIFDILSVGGKNNVNVLGDKNTLNVNVKLGSQFNYVVNSGNLGGDTSIVMNNTDINITGNGNGIQTDWGYNFETKDYGNVNVNSTLNFKGNNNIVIDTNSNDKRGINFNNAVKQKTSNMYLTSDKGSSLNIDLKTVGKKGIGIMLTNPEEAVGDITSNLDGSIKITSDTPERTIGIYLSSFTNSKNTMTLNSDVDINVAVPIWLPINSELSITGNGNVKLTGNIISENASVINISLLNDESYINGTINPTVNSTGKVNLKMENNSVFNKTGLSIINDLDISNSKIVFLGKSHQLGVQNLSGNDGQFNMRANVQNQDETDVIYFGGITSGNHKIFVENTPTAKSTGKEFVKLVNSNETAQNANYNATFTLANSPLSVPKDSSAEGNKAAVVEQGGYLYTLGRSKDSKAVKIDDENNNNWYLYPLSKDEQKSPSADLSINNLKNLYYLSLLENDTLLQRLGEIKYDSIRDKDFDFYIRTKPGYYNFYQGKYKTYFVDAELGINKEIQKKNWLNYLGGLIAYSYANTNNSASNINSIKLGAYSTHINKNNGLYIDNVAKYSAYFGLHQIPNTSNEIVKFNTTNHLLRLSSEIGKKFYNNEQDKYYAEPQAQLTYTGILANKYVDSKGLEFKNETVHSLIGRLSMLVGREYEHSNLYAKLGLEKEFLGNVTYYLNESKENENLLSNVLFDYGIGYTHRTDKGQIYSELHGKVGYDFYSLGGNIGYRYSW